jgi:hypothetical protein
MAKKSAFKNRFPQFKILLFLALVLGLPLSVWTVINAPTTIQQQASSLPKEAPTNLSAKSICNENKSLYNFSWNQVPNSSGYNFYYYYSYVDENLGSVTKHKGPLKTIGFPLGTFSLHDLDLPDTTETLFWYVRAKNLSGAGPASEIATAPVACPVK